MKKEAMLKLVLLPIVFVFLFSCNERLKKEKRTINGQVIEAVFLKDGTITGEAVYYDSTGSVLQRSSFVNGFEDGASVRYFSNERMQDSMNFRNGLRNGFQYRFDSLGHLNSINFFYYGMKMGPDFIYRNGKFEKYFFTDFNKEDIVDLRYDSTGDIDTVILFKMKLAITKVLVGDESMTGIFFYLPEFPGADINYSFGVKDENNNENMIFSVDSNRVFIDTIIATPLKKEHYYAKASIKSKDGNFNRVYLEEIVW